MLFYPVKSWNISVQTTFEADKQVVKNKGFGRFSLDILSGDRKMGYIKIKTKDKVGRKL